MPAPPLQPQETPSQASFDDASGSVPKEQTQSTLLPSSGVPSRDGAGATSFANACTPVPRWQDDLRGEHRVFLERFKAIWHEVVVQSKNDFAISSEARLSWQQRMTQGNVEVSRMVDDIGLKIDLLQGQVQRLAEAVQQQTRSSSFSDAFYREQQDQPLEWKLLSEAQVQQEPACSKTNLRQPLNALLPPTSKQSAGDMIIENMVQRIVKLSEVAIIDRLDEVQLLHLARLDTIIEDSACTQAKVDELLHKFTDKQLSSAGPMLGQAETVEKRESLKHLGEVQPVMSHTFACSVTDVTKSQMVHGVLKSKQMSTIMETSVSPHSRKSLSLNVLERFATRKETRREAREGPDGQQDADVLERSEAGVTESPVQNCLRYTQIASFLLVIMNTVYMAISLDIAMKCAVQEEPFPWWIGIVDRLFIVAFCLEMMLRLLLEKRQFFTGLTRWWNLFDTCVVLFQLIALLEVNILRNTTWLRLIRIASMARAARAMRTVNSLRIFRILICGEVWQPLFWGFLVIIALTFLVALLATEIVSHYVAQNDGLPPRLLDLYGSVPKTMVTLYMAISFGEPWRTLLLPLEVMSPWMRLLFLFYIVSINLGLVNTITAAFVDGLIHVSNLDRDTIIHDRNSREKDQLRELRELLLCRPLNPDGKISRYHLMKTLMGDGADMLKALGLQLNVAKAIFQMLDTHDQNSVDIDEFIHSLLHLQGNNPVTIRLATLMHQNKQLLARVCRLSHTVEDHVLPLLHGVDPQLLLVPSELK